MIQSTCITHSLQQVEQYLEDIFQQHELSLVKQITQHSLFRQGKRVRARLILLTGELVEQASEPHIILATIIELLHGATLLHDDVIDQSEIRRHHKTAHTIWGNKASILIGDLIYAEAFKLMSKLNNPGIIQTLSQATSRICIGEIHQLSQRGNHHTSMAEYLSIIEAKTAALFAAGTHCAAQISPLTDPKPLIDFGHHFGMAYQLTDDLLDLMPDNPQFDKNIGDDIRDGKVTGPVIELIEKANSDTVEQIAYILDQPTQDNIAMLQRLLESDSSPRTRELIQTHITCAVNALSPFPSSQAKEILTELALSLKNRLH